MVGSINEKAVSDLSADQASEQISELDAAICLDSLAADLISHLESSEPTDTKCKGILEVFSAHPLEKAKDAATVHFEVLKSRGGMGAAAGKDQLESASRLIKTCSRCTVCIQEVTVAANQLPILFGPLVILGVHFAKHALVACQEALSFGASHDPAMTGELLCGSTCLLTELMTLLDRIEPSEMTDGANAKACASVLVDLAQCAYAAKKSDVRLTVAIHKFIVRFFRKHKGACSLQATIPDVLNTLSAHITDGLTSALAQEVQTNSMKGLKLVAFQLKVVSRLVEDFAGMLDENTLVLSVFDVVVNVLRLLPPFEKLCGIPAAAGSVEEVEECLQEPVRQLLVAALPLQAAPAACAQLVVSGRRSGDILKFCVALLQVLEESSELIKGCWMADEDTSMLHSLMLCVENCHADFAMSTELHYCRGDRAMTAATSTLSHFVTMKVCSFILSLPALTFGAVERWLLQCQFSAQPYCSLLAVDVWDFVSKHCPAAVCYDHCCLLADVLLLLEDESANAAQVGLALTCLLKALHPDYQAPFTNKYSSQPCARIWPLIPLTIWDQLPGGVQSAVNSAVTSKLVQFVDCGLVTIGNPVTLTNSLAAMLSQLGGAINRSHSESSSQSCLAELATQMWCLLLPPARRMKQQAAWADILSGLPAAVMLTSQNADGSPLLCEVLAVCLESYTQSACIVKIAMCYLLVNLSDKTIRAFSKQAEIFTSIRRLFVRLLSDDTALVKLVALHAFKTFAERTPHTDIVASTTEQSNQVRDAVVQYISMDSCAPPAPLEHLLAQQASLLSAVRASAGRCPAVLSHPPAPVAAEEGEGRGEVNGLDLQPPHKRKREGTGAVVDYCTVSEDLRSVIGLLKTASSRLQQSDRHRVSQSEVHELAAACRLLIDTCTSWHVQNT